VLPRAPDEFVDDRLLVGGRHVRRLELRDRQQRGVALRQRCELFARMPRVGRRCQIALQRDVVEREPDPSSRVDVRSRPAAAAATVVAAARLVTDAVAVVIIVIVVIGIVAVCSIDEVAFVRLSESLSSEVSIIDILMAAGHQ
jgi:hypothetical protein